jgi:6-phosphogluconolactonase (cycloisomerase 2 family)
MMRFWIGAVCLLVVSALLMGGRANALGLSDVLSSGKDMAKKLEEKKEADEAQKKKDEDAKRKKAAQEEAQRAKQQGAGAPAPSAKPAPATASPAGPAKSAPAVAAGPGVPGGFVYMVGRTVEGMLATYAINTSNATLEEVPGSPLRTKQRLNHLALAAGGKFLYARDREVSGFAINPATGLPAQMAGSPFKLGENLETIALDPSGTVLYAAFGAKESEEGSAPDGHFAAYAIDPGTGVPREIAGSRSPLAHAQTLAIAPDGKFAYMVDGVSNEPLVHTFAIDPKTHAFKEVPKTRVPGGVAPEMLKFRPDGKFLYLIDSRSGPVAEGEANILVYRVNPTTGALAAVPGSPFEVGHGACYLATDPGGKFVFAANCGSSTAAAFTADPASGVLAQVAGSPFRGGTGPVSLAVEPSGNYLYVPNQSSGDIAIWIINPASGVLTSISKYPLKISGNFQDIVIRP